MGVYQLSTNASKIAQTMTPHSSTPGEFNSSGHFEYGFRFTVGNAINDRCLDTKLTSQDRPTVNLNKRNSQPPPQTLAGVRVCALQVPPRPSE